MQAPEFAQIQLRAKELGTELHYRRIDVRDTELLNNVIEAIGNAEGRMDGLVAAAGIQQETPALEYSAKDSNTMFEVNVTGVFMTAQAVAKQMIRFGNGGSIAMIASMSGTVANRVRSHLPSFERLNIFLFGGFLLRCGVAVSPHFCLYCPGSHCQPLHGWLCLTGGLARAGLDCDPVAPPFYPFAYHPLLPPKHTNFSQ
jgi:NAD(P)-dependent dehydrogenase (short-subunit alcohol dehydrogenase family)